VCAVKGSAFQWVRPGFTGPFFFGLPTFFVAFLLDAGAFAGGLAGALMHRLTHCRLPRPASPVSAPPEPPHLDRQGRRSPAPLARPAQLGRGAELLARLAPAWGPGHLDEPDLQREGKSVHRAAPPTNLEQLRRLQSEEVFDIQRRERVWKALKTEIAIIPARHEHVGRGPIGSTAAWQKSGEPRDINALL
jgi:hypothetical protein